MSFLLYAWNWLRQPAQWHGRGRHPRARPRATRLQRPVPADRGGDRAAARRGDRAHRPRRVPSGHRDQRLALRPHSGAARAPGGSARVLGPHLADPAGRARDPAHLGQRLRRGSRGRSRPQGRGRRPGHDPLAAGAAGRGPGGASADHRRVAHRGDLHRGRRRRSPPTSGSAAWASTSSTAWPTTTTARSPAGPCSWSCSRSGCSCWRPWCGGWPCRPGSGRTRPVPGNSSPAIRKEKK